MFQANGILTLIHCTIASNVVRSTEFTNSAIALGGVAVAHLRASILAGNYPTNLFGSVVDDGYNLSSDNFPLLTASSSRNGVDPRLASLSDNGGLTPTMALLLGSPAVDAVPDSVAPPTDQRGVARPMGAAADIGAFEFGPKLALVRKTTGEVQLSCLLQPLRSYTLSQSMNLIDWRLLGTAQTDTNGVFWIQDNSSTDTLQQFYRVQ